jgi:hypothetical protein
MSNFKPTKHLFLDLQGTIVDTLEGTIHNAKIIDEHALAIKRFIDATKPDFVHVFSNAIIDAEMQYRFNKYLRPKIETALGVKLSFVPTLDNEIRKACCAANGLVWPEVSTRNLLDFYDRGSTFYLYVQAARTWAVLRDHPDSIAPLEVTYISTNVNRVEFVFPRAHLSGNIWDISEVCNISDPNF